METLEQSRVCRLCGKQAGLTVKIFDKRENHVKKINSVLPIVVHEMDLLPKHMCHTCNFKLREFHEFYENCLRTDAELKSQLSWMQGSNDREKIILPMVQISNVQIKTEPPDYDDDDSARAIFNDENFAGLALNRQAPPEEMFLRGAVKRAPRECRDGVENCTDDDVKKVLKPRPDRRAAKENNQVLSDVDAVRRNLFATEIFGGKNSLVETTTASSTDKPLRNLDRRQKIVRSRTDDETPNLRILRPRKRRASLVSSARAKRSSRTCVAAKNISEIRANVLPAMEIKLEALEARARTLRPRTEAVDYSECKRKNSMARTNVSRRETIEYGNVERTAINRANRVIGAYAVKLENDWDLGERISCANKIRTDPKASRDCKAEMTLKKIPKTRGRRSASGETEVGRRKNSETNFCHPSFYLRSQRRHLRSGRLKQFDWFVEKPKSHQSATGSENISSATTKRRGGPENERSSKIVFKHRYCDLCKARFASAELYMLHGCYANKRH